MKIGMMGMGKLGLPSALAIESRGHEVIGYDIDPAIEGYIKDRKVPYKEKDIQQYLDKTNIKFVDVDDMVGVCDIIFVTVQTPHDPRFEGVSRLPDERVDFDYTYLEIAIRHLAETAYNKDLKQIVSIVSTVLPGTIDRLIKPIIEEQGDSLQMAYNPFFIAMSTTIEDFLYPEFVLLGMDDPDAIKVVENFYKLTLPTGGGQFFIPKIFKCTIKTAEAIKVMYNTYITQKIVFANASMELCHRIGADVDDLIDCLSLGTKRITSPLYMRGGMGDGGGCLTPGQLIITSNGHKKIENIQVGDQVLSHEGRFRKVISTYEREYKGEIIEFKIAGSPMIPLKVTSDHPIFIARRKVYGPRVIATINNGYDKYKRKPTRLATPLGYYSKEFSAAEDIELGDAIISKFKINKDEVIQPIAIRKEKHYEPLNVIRVTSEYMELLGWYLAEGSTTIYKSKYEVRFSLGGHEGHIAEWIKKMLLKWHGVNARIKFKNNNCDVRVYSKRFGDQALKLFGSGAANKKIPYSWLYLPVEHLKTLLFGMFAGDGSVDKKKFHYYTTSLDLTYFIILAFKRLNIKHGMSIRPARIDKNGVNHLISYIIRSSDSKVYELLTKKFEETKNRRTTWYEDEYYYCPIKSIEKHQYEGIVYNLEVDKDNSYSTINASVSNCHPRDNIALSAISRSLSMSYDWWENLMIAREKQTEFLAKIIIDYYNQTKLPVVILGKAFKAETNLTGGSPSILLYNILKETVPPGLRLEIFDPHVDGKIDGEGDIVIFQYPEPGIFFIGTKHEVFANTVFPAGSIVIDPWRYIPDQEGVKVIRIGEGTKIK